MTESEQEKEHHAKHHAGKPQHETDAGKHKEQNKEQKEIRITLPEIKGLNLSAIAAVALLVIVVFQSFQAFTVSQKLDAMAAEAQELNRLPAVQLTAISVESSVDCEQCTPVDTLISDAEKARANVTRSTVLKVNDAESQELIGKYDIARLPAVIITGEIDKVTITGFTKVNDALISQTPQPYVLPTGKIRGLVSLTYVNVSSCKECPDLMGVVQQLRAQIKVADFKAVDKDSEEGKKLVTYYEMARLPGILISSDVNEYPVAAPLAQIGSVKKDGFIALGANPPYLNVSTGKITGITQLILLNDSSCTGCYDITMHIPIVRRFQVNPVTIKVTDAASAEGKELISRYKITAVPTILVTGDVSPYEQLLGIWPTVGTTEKDGALVFRTMSAIAGSPYKDLTTGKVEQNLPRQVQQQ
ncbi:hypothetical protein HYV85_01490 [Candidatus Woesearchaeota archaeon]|nr:hypothetical protein [Candidatus Woesearchaeota archaeon]